LPPAALLSREAPWVVPANLLNSREAEDLIRRGFAARVSCSAELWPAASLSGRSLAGTEWNVIVDFEPLSQVFRVVRLTRQEGAQSLGSYSNYGDVTSLLARPYQPLIRAPVAPGRYFYAVRMQVERMTANDLEDMRAWLGGTTRNNRGTGSAVVGFITSMVRSLIGANSSVYEGRSPVFEISR
jgi:hypothetical protein